MDYVKIAEIATRVVVTAGVGRIINQTVKNNVGPGNRFQRITVPAGSFAIGGVVSNVAVAHAVETVTEVVGVAQSVVKNLRTL